MGDLALAAIEQASAIVTVVGPDVTSIRGARLSLDVLRELRLLPATAPIVLNNVERRVGFQPGDAASIIGSPVDVVVPRSRAVLRGGNLGIPVLLSAPRDPAARALREVARRLDENLTRREWRTEAATPRMPAPPRKKKVS